MTAKTEVLRVRISPELKQSVQKILEKLGLSTSEAINIYFKQIEMEQGLPFEVKIPNKETRKVIDDALKGKNIKSFKNVEDLFKDLGI
ncbi:MAG: hypothetical protein A2Y25_07565 [Candidatus Melainabacteria bacterium GWF2_37_15]|nr:MAG: hypothetical protein A2Y25_07565 [Candidatus Melainabacteria bacterium GWF2_37_15]